MDHALVKLARTIDWRFLEEKLGAVYKDGAGQPPLPTRLMAGLAILKHTYNLSDEVVCDLWHAGPARSSRAKCRVRSGQRPGAASTPAAPAPSRSARPRNRYWQIGPDRAVACHLHAN
jgi:hypothetical protein